MLSVRNRDSFKIAPCSREICWNIRAQKHCSFAHNYLFLQCLLQYQRWMIVMQSEFSTFFDWEVFGNHLVHFPPKSGMTKGTLHGYQSGQRKPLAPHSSTGGHLLCCARPGFAGLEPIWGQTSGTKHIKSVTSLRHRAWVAWNLLSAHWKVPSKGCHKRGKVDNATETRGILWLREKQHTAKQEKGQWLLAKRGKKPRGFHGLARTPKWGRATRRQKWDQENEVVQIPKEKRLNSRKKCRVTKTKVPLQRREAPTNRKGGPALRRAPPSKGLAGRCSFAATAENRPSSPAANHHAKLLQQEAVGVAGIGARPSGRSLGHVLQHLCCSQVPGASGFHSDLSGTK